MDSMDGWMDGMDVFFVVIEILGMVYWKRKGERKY